MEYVLHILVHHWDLSSFYVQQPLHQEVVIFDHYDDTSQKPKPGMKVE